MTIIVPVKREVHPGKFIYGLAGDLVYSPFSNPTIMERGKVFQGEDFVWGVIDDITVLNIDAITSPTFDDFKGNLKAGTADSIIVACHEDQFFTYDCNEGKKVWSIATFTHEPLSWGCFKYPFDASFNPYLVHDVEVVYNWLYNLHSLYGFVPEDECENLIIKDTCVKFSRDGVKKLGYHGGL